MTLAAASCALLLAASLGQGQTPAPPQQSPQSPADRCSCWIDTKTGKQAPTVPLSGVNLGGEGAGAAQMESLDPKSERAFNPKSGKNYARTPNGCWIDVKTGEQAPTVPLSGVNLGGEGAGAAQMESLDPKSDRAFNPKSGKNYARVPCPPPEQAASTPVGPSGAPPSRTATALERSVLDEINKARTDPMGYRLDSCRYPGAAVEVGRSFLRMAMPIAPLRWDDRLAGAAGLQEADQGPRGQDSHVSSDGSTPMRRMQKAGVWSMVEDEVISVGQGGAGCVVGQLIIDPPDTLHLHRGVLFDPMMKSAGVACGPNAKFGVMCVIDLAGAPVPRD